MGRVGAPNGGGWSHTGHAVSQFGYGTPSTVNMVYTQPQELAQSVLTVHTAHLILADMTHMVTRFHTQVFPHLPHFQLVVPGLPPLQPADFKLGR